MRRHGRACFLAVVPNEMAIYEFRCHTEYRRFSYEGTIIVDEEPVADHVLFDHKTPFVSLK